MTTKPVTQMTDVEILEHIKELRAQREARFAEQQAPKTKAPRATKAPAEPSTRKIFNDIAREMFE